MIATPRRLVRGDPGAARRMDGLWSVVLAAGGARRFGRHKLLRRIGTGSLLARTLRCAETVTPGRCIVVLGCAASRLRRELGAHPAHAVVNRRWSEGMSTSLQAGLAALPSRATGALVLLADQYALEPADLRRLAAAWARDPERAAAAELGGRVAAPAILPRGWFQYVLALRGDEGARRLLRDPSMPPITVAMPAAAMDLDAPAQLAAFRQHARRVRSWAIG